MKDLIEILKSKHKTIGIAESMTGGFLASRFVEIKGVSEVFKGSLVCYNEHIKIDVLKVDTTLIKTWGVVSKEMAMAMSKQASKLFSSDIGISVTGYAESPSFAHVCLYMDETYYHHEITYPGYNRLDAIEKVTSEVMDLLHKVLLSL
jgi:nicotinamide-nucleotide amidase